MPNIDTAVVARAAATSALTDLIGTSPMRLAPIIVPESWPLPAVAYQPISDVREEVMGVNAGVRHARVQLTILGRDYPECLAVSNACATAYNRFRGSAGGVVVQDTFIENIATGLDSESGQDAGEGTMSRTMDLLFHYEG